MSYNSPRSNHRALADVDAADDGDIGAQPHVIFYDYLSPGVSLLGYGSGFIIEYVVAGPYNYVGRDQHVVS